MREALAMRLDLKESRVAVRIMIKMLVVMMMVIVMVMMVLVMRRSRKVLEDLIFNLLPPY